MLLWLVPQDIQNIIHMGAKKLRSRAVEYESLFPGAWRVVPIGDYSRNDAVTAVHLPVNEPPARLAVWNYGRTTEDLVQELGTPLD